MVCACLYLKQMSILSQHFNKESQTKVYLAFCQYITSTMYMQIRFLVLKRLNVVNNPSLSIPDTSYSVQRQRLPHLSRVFSTTAMIGQKTSTTCLSCIPRLPPTIRSTSHTAPNLCLRQNSSIPKRTIILLQLFRFVDVTLTPLERSFLEGTKSVCLFRA